ncbi:capsular polysaccharide export protein [Poseidonocella pacifica]|uniref:Capsular polysaccharide export protein n=1 Tax=Poseidonocella pacifica TaxID=871651 RepID=A0A1I0V6E8_9RHOB|nr:capsule biosynthesis protein CapA [Poseidonocella pacifica]SFA71663.1 capsular polysaccharide export protein [Poseidonocella pacifica]
MRRSFLFLQGPHGPFFYLLGKQLRHAGHEVRRVGFNGADRAFWPDGGSYHAYRAPLPDWPASIESLLDEGVTDLVLYGDTREVHITAMHAARSRGLRVHVFEEGYLRPYWVTYERDGANGHSPLASMSLDEIRAKLPKEVAEPRSAPAHWGDLRQHIFYGALYHGLVMATRRSYPAYRSHRDRGVGAEFRLYLRRLMLMPAAALRRRISTARIRAGGYPYHVALLQLAHDSSALAHSPFRTPAEFVESVVGGFAQGAPRHHHLVFKAHPLEDGRAGIARTIIETARRHAVSDRVHYLLGGKLGPLLDEASSAVTVSSTSAHQALWRGLPVKAFGEAVFCKPGITSQAPIAAFFAQPDPPDPAAYADLRAFMLRSSQLRGSYYSRGGRRQLLRIICDRMFADEAPYEMSNATPATQLTLVR